MASFSVSESEDSMSQGEAGNVKFQRKFSVADYTEILNRPNSSTTRTTPGPSQPGASSHPIAPAELFQTFLLSGQESLCFIFKPMFGISNDEVPQEHHSSGVWH